MADTDISIPTYYWSAIPNFGDLLTSLLLHRFSGIKAELSLIEHAKIIGVGSILEHIPYLWNGHILGSGRLFPDSELYFSKSIAKIWGLRGPLSAKGIKGDFVLGDPGLLADELVTVETKKYDLGIVPHWSDYRLAYNPTFLPFDRVVIDPRQDPLTVIRTIGECRKIVSSSLHGLVVADAFGLPRRFEYTSKFDHEGGLFKFRDYSAALGAPFEVGKTIQVDKFHVEDRQHELFDMFTEFGKFIRKEQ